MKLISLAVASILGMVSLVPQNVKAINVSEKTSMNKLHKSKDGHSMISIGLTQMKYENDRYKEYIKPLSSESNKALAQALNIPTVTGRDGHVSLQQDDHHIVDVSMVNFQNMGYEGSFLFGNPSQELQVIFDTGSAWAWVFSETCGTKDSKCPGRSKKFKQSQSKNFKINKKEGEKLQYGKGAIIGHPSEDKGCFSQDEKSCLKKFNFLTVVEGDDLEGLKGSGLIGIAPTPAKDQELTDQLTNGVAGFIAQMRFNKDFNKEFDQVFSIYLSNDFKTPGDISFGGYDLDNFAKNGKEIIWADQSSNEAYWAVNTLGAKFGKTTLAKHDQQVIFDNGMSLAMMPEKSFVPMVKSLLDYGFKCKESMPLWQCQGSFASYAKLPPISINLLLDPKGQSAKILMPKEAYMTFDTEQNTYFLLISPWSFKGIGGQQGEEYWKLGAQFLQNYYSIYDFKNKKIGLVESITSIL